MIRTVFRTLALILFCSPALATPQQLLSDLQTMRLSAIHATTDFYMFSGLNADKQYQRRIDLNLEAFNRALDNARPLAEVSQLTDDLAAIATDWQTFQELMSTNRADRINQGFPNVRLVDEMGQISAAIVSKASQMYADVQTSSGIQPNPVVQQSRDLAVLMGEITAQYTARGTSNLGQVFVGNFKRTLTELAEEFQQRLTVLEGHIKTEPAQVLMSSIQSKWNFMAERIRNYNENSVPFLVVSYNDRIIEHLVELEQMHQ